MRSYRDPLGRPIRWLYLKTEVLDRRCEGIMREFMNRRSGGYRLPIPTDELIRLLEERAGKVDTYADLPEGIHGQTLLFYDRRPIVRIAERASIGRAATIACERPRRTNLAMSGFTLPCGARLAHGWLAAAVQSGPAIATTLSTRRKPIGSSSRPAG